MEQPAACQAATNTEGSEEGSFNQTWHFHSKLHRAEPRALREMQAAEQTISDTRKSGQILYSASNCSSSCRASHCLPEIFL